MSLMELLRSMQGAAPVLTGIGLAFPLLLYGWGRMLSAPRTSPSYGAVSSVFVAIGLIGAVLGLLLSLYLHNTGTNLVTDVRWDVLVVPWWFGLGNLFAVTRFVPFSELREYPMLRRVWALLSAAGLVFVAFLILRHTYWLVFSGIMGFVIVAIIAWTAFQVLFRRGTEPPPDSGDPDFFDDVAGRSRRRVARLAEQMTPRPGDRPKKP